MHIGSRGHSAALGQDRFEAHNPLELLQMERLRCKSEPAVRLTANTTELLRSGCAVHCRKSPSEVSNMRMLAAGRAVLAMLAPTAKMQHVQTLHCVSMAGRAPCIVLRCMCWRHEPEGVLRRTCVSDDVNMLLTDCIAYLLGIGTASVASAEWSCCVHEYISAAVHSHRQWTEVCWSGVRAPAADDIVALSVPADALDRATAPVKYKWAALAAGHLSNGRGCHE